MKAIIYAPGGIDFNENVNLNQLLTDGYKECGYVFSSGYHAFKQTYKNGTLRINIYEPKKEVK